MSFINLYDLFILKILFLQNLTKYDSVSLIIMKKNIRIQWIYYLNQCLSIFTVLLFVYSAFLLYFSVLTVELILLIKNFNHLRKIKHSKMRSILKVDWISHKYGKLFISFFLEDWIYIKSTNKDLFNKIYCFEILEIHVN